MVHNKGRGIGRAQTSQKMKDVYDQKQGMTVKGFRRKDDIRM